MNAPADNTPAFTEAIIESISDGVFTVDPDWRVTSFNRAAEQITGVSRQEAIGRACWEVFRAGMCEADCALHATLDSGQPIVNRETFIVNAEGKRIPISVSTAVLRDEDGQVIGGAETFRDLSLVEQLRKELEGRFELGDLVSRSPLMQKIFDFAPAIAASPSTVLLLGETGTGKELLARALHNASPRANGPFMAVNCAALPDTLLESELFGYEAGAFTGADHAKAGRLAAAAGGTLFLDEIGDISPALQVRLLRVLQEKTYEPLGATQPVATDVRVITATNRNLEEAVDAGHFRQDLYYRIKVVRIELPPLRERREDIPLLAEHFIKRFNRLRGKAIQGLDEEAMTVLLAHDWPGNVRELENTIEHAFVLCSSGEIHTRHLPPEFRPLGEPIYQDGQLDAVLKAVEARLIREALEAHEHNRAATARALGIHKTTLFRKMKALDLDFPDQDGRHKR